MRSGSKMLILSCVMGKKFKCTTQIHGASLIKGYDSHTDPSENEYILFDPSQLLLIYVVEFEGLQG